MSEGWEVGERPKVPMPYFRLPSYQYTHAHVRRDDGEFASKKPHDWHRETHARRGHQRRPGEGWASKLHPRTLDYRTVDNLGMHPDELDLDRKPLNPPEKLEVLQADYQDEAAQQGRAKPARELENAKRAFGYVKQFRYEYFKVVVPHKNVTLKIEIATVNGDPDIFVCNRNTNPTQGHHTWKSAGTGDDQITILPDDPLFYPGAFYVGVYGIVDSHFEITASYVRHRAQVQHQTQMMGSGYADVRGELRLADTRRVFCRHGTGFMEQLHSRVAHHSSNPPQHLSADWPWPASRVLLCTSSPSCSHP